MRISDWSSDVCSSDLLAVDYSIHFFSDRFRDPKPWTGMDGLRHVGVPITVGMGTTLLAYCSFLIPPFPGLRQMALLSMTGLVASYLTVILAYPHRQSVVEGKSVSVR